jgi:hypothetical protein
MAAAAIVKLRRDDSADSYEKCIELGKSGLYAALSSRVTVAGG